MKQIEGIQYQVSEWSYFSEKQYSDSFNEVELDLLITDNQNNSWRVPAFWAGGHEWQVRFAPPEPKKYIFITECSDKDNSDNSDEYDLGSVSGKSKGQWQAPEVPLCQDRVLILEKKD